MTTKTIEEIRETRDHLAMMQNPDHWPTWPRLPLKRGNDFNSIELGFLIALDSNSPEPIVHLGFIYVPGSIDRKVKKYDSLESIVADGWEVTR